MDVWLVKIRRNDELCNERVLKIGKISKFLSFFLFEIHLVVH